MKRQEKAKVALEAAKEVALEPKAGMGVMMWLDRNDIGVGYRHLMVLRVGHKFVTLFYVPHMYAFRLTHDDWAKLRPQAYEMAPGYLLEYLRKRTAMYDSLNMRYSAAETVTAQSLLKGLAAHDRTATAPRLPRGRIPSRTKAEPSGTTMFRRGRRLVA